MSKPGHNRKQREPHTPSKDENHRDCTEDTNIPERRSTNAASMLRPSQTTTCLLATPTNQHRVVAPKTMPPSRYATCSAAITGSKRSGVSPRRNAEPYQGRARSPRNTAFKKVAAPVGVAGVDSDGSRTFVRTTAPRQTCNRPANVLKELNVAATLRDDCIASTMRRSWRGQSGHPPPATRSIPEAHLTNTHPAVQRTRVVAARCRG